MITAKKQASLALAIISAMSLTQCQSLPNNYTNSTNILPKNSTQYPTTRTQSDEFDPFLSGELGRPANLVGGGVSSRTLAPSNPQSLPDTGINRQFGELLVDKYRWLENIDLISPEYQQETQSDRERNFIGTLLENERPNGQLDNRSVSSLQQINPNAPKSEVTTWVDAQQHATMTYLDAIPIMTVLRKNVANLYDFEHSINKVKTKKAGELHLFRGKDGYQRVVRTDDDGKTHELWRETDLEWGLRNSSVGDFFVSKDGSYFALVLTTGASDSDKAFLHVFDSLTGQAVMTPKTLGYASDILWLSDDTFLYLSTNYPYGIHRHTIGSKSHNDPVEVSGNLIQYAGAPYFANEDDERYLIIPTTIAELDDAFYIKDRQTGKLYRPYDKKVADKKRTYAEFFVAGKYVHFDPKTGDVWLISGENNDQYGEIIKTNIHNLKKREIVVPVNTNYEHIHEAVYYPKGDGYFLITYHKDGQHRLILTDHQGNVLKDLTPAESGFSDALYMHVVGADKQDNNNQDEGYVGFRYQHVGLPRTVYKYSIEKGEFIDIRRRDLYPFDHTQFETKLVKYKSKDGTQIPMSITYKKGMVLNGKNPTMLYSYGGFSVPMSTWFTVPSAVWLEHGGIYAQPHIRGGNDFAETWHAQGKLSNKLNVFDDFEAAADYLTEQGYTSPNYLMINGASNGGLLVGASMTLAPHKYRVAVPSVGVLDMMRHDQKYYQGKWDGEYGSAYDNRYMYEFLRAYSPYHNVKAGVCYPSTLVTTAKRDDRVLPFHSYKFAAALQEHQSCNRPTYLFVDETQGHGPTTPRQRKSFAAAMVGFSLHEMGVTSVPEIARPSVATLKGEKWLKEEADAKAKQTNKP